MVTLKERADEKEVLRWPRTSDDARRKKELRTLPQVPDAGRAEGLEYPKERKLGARGSADDYLGKDEGLLLRRGGDPGGR